MQTKPIWITATFFVLMVLVAFYLTLFLPAKKQAVMAPAGQASTSTAATSTDSTVVSGTASTSSEVVSQTLAYKDVLHVFNFTNGAMVSSPLHVEGEAKGWYFEAAFPIKITDLKGNVLGSGPAAAEGDWTIADFVPFAADITFIVPAAVSSGFIVFSKDNPSGDPQYADSFKVPVVFKK
jgi:hypothetical protein